MKIITAGLFALLATVSGGTIVSVTGTGNGQAVADWIGETWTQTGSYSNVTISATLNGGQGSPTTADVYLMTQLGPGTTAANQIALIHASIPSFTSGITLFTGLTLGPGTYYLLANEQSAGWTGSSNPVITTDSGVTNISSFINTSAIAAYAPATSFSLSHNGDDLFTVTGTPASSAVPEPATFGLLMAPLALLAGVALARRMALA